MKKTLYAIAAAAVVCFTSCQVEFKAPESVGTTLRAVVEAPTKVSANPVGVYAWQASDKIDVLDSDGYPHVFVASSAGASSEFTSANSITLGKYAGYPSTGDLLADGDEVYFTIPASITYSAEATNMPMLGKISGDAATFKAVGGLLKLVVYGVPSDATEIALWADSKKISGEFVIADASVANPAISTKATDGTDNSITIDFSGKRSDHMVFYFPLPTGSIDGFTIIFNDTDMTYFEVDKTLSVERNGIILAPTMNLYSPITLLSESFTTDLTDGGSPATATVSDYNGEKKGQTVYGANTVDYSINSITGTKLYVDQNTAKGAASGELLLAKKEDSTNGQFLIEGIPSAGKVYASVSFVTNATGENRCSVSSPTEGVEVFNRVVTGSSAPVTVKYNISIRSGVTNFDLLFSNSNGSNNTRVDDILVQAAAPCPTIIFEGNGTRTISAGSNTATNNVTGVSLLGAVDGTGIGVSTSNDWLSASLTGSTLSISSTEYNHSEEDRIGYVYLKATGASTKQITVTQRPSIVASPSLSRTAGDRSFTVSWTPDVKAKTYVAYYSTTADLADPASSGTELTIDDSGSPYTATASGLTNGTTYYIYVKVSAVADVNAAVYSPSTLWATTTATPSAIVVSTYTWTLASGDLGSSGSPASPISKGTLSTTSAAISWTAAYTWYDEEKYFSWSSTKGVQIGKGDHQCTSAVFSTTGFTAPVTKIVVNASIATSGTSSLSVSVNGVNFENSGNTSVALTTTATDYTFTGSATGTVVVTITNSGTKAEYLKSIKINTD